MSDPIPPDHDDEHDPEHQPETSLPHRAYAEADTLTFRGKPLASFSPRRLIAAQSVGLRLWNLAPEEKAAWAAGGMYPGMYGDMILVTYLCACPLSEVLRAVRQPVAVQESALAWADEHNVGIDDQEAIDCLVSSFGAMAASASEPVPQKGTSAGGKGAARRRGPGSSRK